MTSGRFRERGSHREGSGVGTPQCVWLCGMRRSGNHAFVRWLQANLGRPTAHINNVLVHRRTRWMPGSREIRYIIDRANGEPLDQAQVTWSTRQFVDESVIGGTGVYFADRDGRPHRSSYLFAEDDRSIGSDEVGVRAAQRLDTELATWIEAHGTENVATLYSVEDHYVTAPPLPRAHESAPLGVVLVRDPANWLASRIRIGMPCGPEVIDSYCAMVDIATNDPQIVGVNYLEWARSPSYRSAIGRTLGLSGRAERPVEGVPSFAGGSSFDGQTFDGEAHRMAIEARYLDASVADDVAAVLRDDDRLLAIASHMHSLPDLR